MASQGSGAKERHFHPGSELYCRKRHGATPLMQVKDTNKLRWWFEVSGSLTGPCEEPSEEPIGYTPRLGVTLQPCRS